MEFIKELSFTAKVVTLDTKRSSTYSPRVMRLLSG